MNLTLSNTERETLEQRCAEERNVRRWRRYQAILLLAEGWREEAVARSLGCCVNSVSNWVGAWRKQGIAGLSEAPHPGRARLLAGQASDVLEGLLATDPQARGWQATGWTVPLLRTELERAGYTVSSYTVRRTLHRQGWRWKRPQYVLGRPDPAYAEKKGR